MNCLNEIALTAEAMRKADSITINDFGISASTLMKNAGKAIFEVLCEEIQDIKNKKFLILCGKGNNGGDGLVLAEYLKNFGCDVELTWGSKNYDVIVDGLLGTGFSGKIKEPLLSLIKQSNNYKAFKVAIDIPSGLNGTFGITEDKEAIFKADLTITLGALKTGFFMNLAKEFTGKIKTVDIGIPLEALKQAFEDKTQNNFNLLSYKNFQELMPIKRKGLNKYSAGSTVLIGGSRGFTGSIVLSSLASLRTGSGITTCAMPENTEAIIASKLTESLILPLKLAQDKGISKDNINILLEKKADAYLIGPGLGNQDSTKEFLFEFLKQLQKPIVIDGSAITLLAENKEIFKYSKENFLLTPHEGEFKRFLTKDKDYNEKEKINLLKTLAKDLNSVILLKGFPSFIATPQGELYVNTTGNEAAATAGTGDVLAGMCVSLIAQGLSLKNAASCGIYLAGLCSDNYTKKYRQNSMIASDLLDELKEHLF